MQGACTQRPALVTILWSVRVSANRTRAAKTNRCGTCSCETGPAVRSRIETPLSQGMWRLLLRAYVARPAAASLRLQFVYPTLSTHTEGRAVTSLVASGCRRGAKLCSCMPLDDISTPCESSAILLENQKLLDSHR